ncbi:cytochrome P450 [Brevibacterium sp. VCM10]|uniref:cytochrome P450 n=1 Tax=Brevibacterium sp. VCM10 TaxID=1381751 RepID=UPI00046F1D7C|nr:cytochrome P450 [Brevibacterium sp. VCM10]
MVNSATDSVTAGTDTSASQIPGIPVLEEDPYSLENLSDPYPFMNRLRAAGPAAWLKQYGVPAFGRDAEVREILEDYRTFISGAGVGSVNIHHNPPLRQPGILEVDPPLHTRMRSAMDGVITPRRLRPRRKDFATYAKTVIDEILSTADGEFDAARLAEQYVLRVFGDAVGIPREGRAENLIVQGAANFATFGPQNEIAKRWIEESAGTYDWVLANCAREVLDPSGMGAQLWEFADSGEISPEEATLLVRALLSAGLDTTIFAITNTLNTLARHPEQYAKVHADPRLVRFAIDESFRLESPFYAFYRTTSKDTVLSGVEIPAETKVLVFPGSANRDEGKWGDDADVYRFDRDSSGHLTFGMGIHQCVGQPISRMEMDAFLSAFVTRIARLEPTGPSERLIHTTLQSYAKVPLKAHAA